MSVNRKSAALIAIAAIGSLVALAAFIGTASAKPLSARKAALAPLKIGMIANIDNPINDNPDAVATAKAAVRGWNSRGGLHGHKLVFVFCTGKADPNQDSACARQMVSQHVIAVVGAAQFGDYLVDPILNNAHIARVGSLPYSPQAAQSPNEFPIGDSFTGFQITNAIFAHAKKKVVSVRLDVPTSAGWESILNAQYQKIAGFGHVSDTAVPGTETDWPTVAAKAKSGGAQVAFFDLQNFQENPLMQAFEQQGGMPIYSPSQLGPSDYGALSGKILQKIINVDAFPALTGHSSNPFIKQMLGDLKAEQNAGDGDAALNKLTQVFVWNTYLAFQAIDQVTKGTKNITAAGVMNALAKAKKINMGGAIPAWTPHSRGVKGPWTYNVGDRSRLVFTFSATGQRVPIIKGFVTLENALAGKYTLTAAGKKLLG